VTIRIAIDCMGGDHGVAVTVPAALAFAAHQPEARLLLVGRQPEIERALAGRRPAAVELVHAEEVVEMNDAPALAMRTKRNSSMRVAINLAKEARADVVVSAGNTGALMAMSRFVLKTLDGIDRPAIAGVIPNQSGRGTTMLDLGANVDCGPDHLCSSPCRPPCRRDEERPTAAAQHRRRGNRATKSSQVGDLPRASPLNFYGNVENEFSRARPTSLSATVLSATWR
jgi:glycerol-3-phosphate acyltransferase PlsX